MTPTLDEVTEYLAETGQEWVLTLVNERLGMEDIPLAFVEEVLTKAYTDETPVPSIQEQLESSDFFFWRAVASLTSGQGFWPSAVLVTVEA